MATSGRSSRQQHNQSGHVGTGGSQVSGMNTYSPTHIRSGPNKMISETPARLTVQNRLVGSVRPF
jgi:hypothetical protein